MKQISIDTQFIKQPVVLCLGTFDGLHLGHKRLIEHGSMIAKENGYKTAVYSFDNIPSNFFSHGKNNKRLFTHDEKISAFESIGIDYFWLDKFDDHIAVISPYDYIFYLKKVLNIKTIVVGFNYTFGQKAAGKTQDLIRFGKHLGFDVCVIDPVKIGEITVSSTTIRSYIQAGEIQKANQMLDYSFSISGKVVMGKQVGRKIDFPTINTHRENGKILPKLGVYATRTIVDGVMHHSITNVGNRPSIDDDEVITVETNIFNFNEVCYDKVATIIFDKFIREEMKFSSLDELKNQITNDVEKVKKLKS